MGCKCAPSNIESDVVNLDDFYNDESNNPKSNENLSEYTKKMFKLINKIRTSPFEFADIIQKLTKYITTTESGNLIFDYHLKIYLAKGKEVFESVAKELREMDAMEPLIFKDDIVIKVPEDEEQIKDIKTFQNKVIEKRKQIQLDDYFKDAIKDPEVAFFMIIIDDTNKNSGRKRKAVLNKEFKYIGISSVKKGNSFCAYYTFAKPTD